MDPGPGGPADGRSGGTGTASGTLAWRTSAKGGLWRLTGSPGEPQKAVLLFFLPKGVSGLGGASISQFLIEVEIRILSVTIFQLNKKKKN